MANTPCNSYVIPNGKLITDFYGTPSEISTGQFYSGTITGWPVCHDMKQGSVNQVF